MNLAQKIAVAVTLLSVAVFLFVGGHKVEAGGAWVAYTAKEIADKGLKNVVSPVPPGVSFLFDGNPDDIAGMVWTTGKVTDWSRTWIDIIGILLVGGAAVLLLGIRRKRPKE
jgi:type IV secretory pathway VirB2 component (pilin)